MACVWLIGVPLALLAAAVWHFPVQLVVICAGVEELSKAFIGLRRVFSGKWIHRLVGSAKEDPIGSSFLVWFVNESSG